MPKIGGFGAGAVNYEAATEEATEAACANGAGATAEAGTTAAATTNKPANGAEAGTGTAARQPANGAEAGANSGAALRARTIIAQPPAGGAEASSGATTTVSAGAAAEAASSTSTTTTSPHVAEGAKIARKISGEGDTGKAQATAEHVRKLMTTSLTDWKVTASEVDEAAALLKALSPKEAVAAIIRLANAPDGKNLAAKLYGHDDKSGFIVILDQVHKAINAASQGANPAARGAAYDAFCAANGLAQRTF